MSNLQFTKHEGTGMYLTNAEIVLCDFYAEKKRKMLEEHNAKLMERKIMSDASKALQLANEAAMNRPKDVKAVAMVKDEVKLTRRDGEAVVTEGKRPRLEISSDDNQNASVVTKSIPEIDKARFRSIDNAVSHLSRASDSSVGPAPTRLPSSGKLEDMTEDGSGGAAKTISSKIKKKGLLLESEVIAAAVSLDDNDPETLFHPDGVVSEQLWSSLSAESDHQLILGDFSFDRKQTLGLRVVVPKESKSWSFNLCPEDDWHNSNVLLHFNPRYKKSELVMNDKQGTWNVGASWKFSSSDGMKALMSSELDLMVQLRPMGFFVFVEDEFCALFPHRRDPGHLTQLKLRFNAKDGNGNAQNVVVHKVWWSRRDPDKNWLGIPEEQLMEDAVSKSRFDFGDRIHERTVVVKGLRVGVFDLHECQAVEFFLTGIFHESGLGPELVSVVPGYGYAFVKFLSSESVDAAIEEFNGAEVEGIDGSKMTLEITQMDSI